MAETGRGTLSCEAGSSSFNELPKHIVFQVAVLTQLCNNYFRVCSSEVNDGLVAKEAVWR